MSTANYVVVSLGDKELSTEGGIAVKGLYSKLLSIKLICGFIVFTDILLNGVRKQATAVQVSLDEENKFHVSNLYGYDLVIDNADLVVATESNSGSSYYLHTLTADVDTLYIINNDPNVITLEDSPIDEIIYYLKNKPYIRIFMESGAYGYQNLMLNGNNLYFIELNNANLVATNINSSDVELSGAIDSVTPY